MIVLANKEFHMVGEAGYQKLILNDMNFDSPTWSQYRDILSAVDSRFEDGSVGICLFNYYFLNGSRLMKEEQMRQLLNQYDVVFPSDKNRRRLTMIISKDVFEDYYHWLIEDGERQIYPEEWLLNNGFKVGYIDCKEIDTDRSPRIYKEIETLTKSLVDKYKKYGYEKLDPINREVANSNKTPIWICWWQGEENMPDIVKKCVCSIRNAFPGDETSIYIIDINNCREYVEFSDSIWKKFQEGRITYTHLSDILRAQLLCRYGGIWVDATCLILDNRFIDTLLKYPFFTRKQGGALNELDIVSGRWASYFLKGPANYKLFRFLVEAFELYWDKYDKLINYFIIDYITAIAYDNFDDVRAVMDAVPQNNAASEVLVNWCNNAYDERKMRVLLYDSWLFKMTYKMEFVKKTTDGKDTFYKYLFAK